MQHQQNIALQSAITVSNGKPFDKIKKGIKRMMMLGRRLRTVKIEERMARKQVNTLGRAVSLLNVSPNPSPLMMTNTMLRRVQSTENLEYLGSKTNNNNAVELAQTLIKAESPLGDLNSPQSPTMQDIGFIAFNKVEDVDDADDVEDVDDPSRDRDLAANKIKEKREEIAAFLTREMVKNFKDLELSNESLKEQVIEKESIDMSDSGMILQQKDSSDKFKRSRSIETMILSPNRTAIAPLSARQMSMTDSIFLNTDLEDEFTDAMFGENSDIMKKIMDNYKSCASHQSTRIDISAAELRGHLRKFTDAIDISGELLDPVNLYIIPLNELCTTRWIMPGNRFRFGRDSSWMQSKSYVVSRHHGEIFHDMNAFYLIDVGSSSGTFLNGIRLDDCEATTVTSATASLPHKLISGDIIQLGIGCSDKIDEFGHLNPIYSSVQFLILLGHRKQASVLTRAESMEISKFDSNPCNLLINSNKPVEQVEKLLSWKKILKIIGKVQSIPRKLECSNVRMYIELGDLFHSDATGLAVVFYKDRPAFSAVYNNFKMNWEIAMTDANGESILTLDVLPSSTSVYSLMKDYQDTGRITAVNNERILIEPSPSSAPSLTVNNLKNATASPFVTPSSLTQTPCATETDQAPPFFAITIDKERGIMYLVQRSITDRRQKLLGEAMYFAIKRPLFGGNKYILEGRLQLVPEYEPLLIMGILFSVLLQIENS